MKRVILFFSVILLLSGCGKVDENKLQTKMQELGNEYFSEFMIGNAISLDVAMISLSDLKEANEIMDAGYDLSMFKGCTDESNIKIYLKSGTTQIEKYEFELNCK